MTDIKICPFCGETIKAIAKKCRYCSEFLDSYTRESVWYEINTSGGTAVGNNVNAARDFIGRDQYNGPVTLGKDKQDEQYEIVLNWEMRGKPKLRGFDLSGRDLSKLELVKADLKDADLRNADLFWANLQGAKLTGANLSNALLTAANLETASLVNAVLLDAHLYDATLTNAFLSNADFSRANLSETDLQGANLHNTNFHEANLTKANLRGVLLSETNFVAAKYDSETKWPDNFDPVAAGAMLVENDLDE